MILRMTQQRYRDLAEWPLMGTAVVFLAAYAWQRDRIENWLGDPEQYRVLVRENKESSQVHVLDRDGAPERSDTARRILSLLHQQLK